MQKKNNVKIQYDIFEHLNANYPSNYFNVIALIYAHTKERSALHQKVYNWFKPDGVLILEGFSKDQLNYNSGGPKDIGMLFCVDELWNDFKDCSEKRIWQEEIELNEGKYHNEIASVVRGHIKK